MSILTINFVFTILQQSQQYIFFTIGWTQTMKFVSFTTLILFVYANPTHPKHKTALCKVYTETGRCPYNEKCRFAHGTAEKKHTPATVSSVSLQHHERRINELEIDLERAWQHIHLLESNN